MRGGLGRGIREGSAHDTEVTSEGEGLTYMTFHNIIPLYTLFVRMTYKHDLTTSSNHKSQYTIPFVLRMSAESYSDNFMFTNLQLIYVK